jgi:hypothetical protein
MFQYWIIVTWDEELSDKFLRSFETQHSKC